MPYAMERFDSSPVISIFLSARRLMARANSELDSEQLSQSLRVAALDHAAGDPSIAYAELRLRIGIHVCVHDERMPDNVIRRSRAYRDVSHANREIRAPFSSGIELRQLASALAA